jgi:predicted DNA-binding transcriptional regulator AlpA
LDRSIPPRGRRATLPAGTGPARQRGSGAPPRPRRRPDYVPDDPLLTAAEAAAETGRAASTFWRDAAAGRLPAAYYVTPRCPRWQRSELRASVEACRARRPTTP